MPSTLSPRDGVARDRPALCPLGAENPGAGTSYSSEDTSLSPSTAQQSKLAALGRLSASIAHEIRNPVGAMSHAGAIAR